MSVQQLSATIQKAIVQPESLWKEEISKTVSVQSFLQMPVFPVIVFVAIVSGVLTKIFGYHIPMLGVIYPSWNDMLLQMIGSVLLYMVSIVVLGWLAAYLAGLFGGRNDLAKAVSMIFWISVPSLAGQVLGTLPYAGWVIALGLGIYSLVLLYKAIPIFLGVPVNERVKHFILFMIGAFLVSMALNMTVGRFFTPKDMMRQMQPDITKQMTPPVTSTKEVSARHNTQKPENPVEDYVESMAKGDYNKDVIASAKKDTFTPPSDGKLTKEMVERFLSFAKRVKVVEKEQAEKMKQKYDKKEKSEAFSITDIFNGLKDITSLATLEMKVVKSNGGNWAEYQWVKDRVREAYYTPSLNATTEYNAKLLKGHEDILKEVL